jgi:hypothetical protein
MKNGTYRVGRYGRTASCLQRVGLEARQSAMARTLAGIAVAVKQNRELWLYESKCQEEFIWRFGVRPLINTVVAIKIVLSCNFFLHV